MLCGGKITAIFCIINDILKEIYAVADKPRKISGDGAMHITVWVAKSFCENQSIVI